jgi:hypothetical protein
MADSMILQGISGLKEIGFFDFLLPFLLFFAVIYGILSKSNIFTGPNKEERKDINAVIAFVIALIATTTSWVLLSLNEFLPWIGFLVIVILGFIILGSMAVGGDITAEYGKYKWIIVPLMVAVTIIIMFFSLGWDEILKNMSIGLSDTDIALVVLGLAAIAIMAGILKSGEAEKAAPKT